MNLVNMAMKYVGPMVAERIATKMGIGGPVANKLIAAALPAILASVIGKSKSSSGLSSILALVTGADKPDANGLGSMFETGGDIDGLAKSGGGMLEGLLGGQGMSALSGALGRYAGVEPAQAGSLLGMLAPAALGSIGNVVAEQKLDDAGLNALFSSQAEHVAKAMPAGFASELKGIPMFDSFKGSMGSATAAVGSAASMAANTAQDGVKKSRGMLPWIIGAAVLAFLAWSFLGRDAADDMSSAVTAGQEFIVGDLNVGEEFGTITGSLTDTFKGITDTASAQAALPQLQDLSGKIGTLSESAGQLTGPAKTGFQTIVATALGQLRPIIEGAIASSGAGAILQPVADQMLNALQGMAG